MLIMEVFTFFFQHLIHLFSVSWAQILHTAQKTKCPIITITYQHVGQVKTKRDWSMEIEYGHEETPLFLST